jgi:hypothetical protein
MTDVVEKLRSTAGPHVGALPVLLHEAADEIERQRKVIACLNEMLRKENEKRKELLLHMKPMGNVAGHID